MIPGNHDRRDNLKPVFADWPTDRGRSRLRPVRRSMIVPMRLIGLDTLVPGKSAGALCETPPRLPRAGAGAGARQADRRSSCITRPSTAASRHMDASGCSTAPSASPRSCALPECRAHPLRPPSPADPRPLRRHDRSIAAGVSHQVMLDLSATEPKAAGVRAAGLRPSPVAAAPRARLAHGLCRALSRPLPVRARRCLSRSMRLGPSGTSTPLIIPARVLAAFRTVSSDGETAPLRRRPRP